MQLHHGSPRWILPYSPRLPFMGHSLFCARCATLFRVRMNALFACFTNESVNPLSSGSSLCTSMVRLCTFSHWKFFSFCFHFSCGAFRNCLSAFTAVRGTIHGLFVLYITEDLNLVQLKRLYRLWKPSPRCQMCKIVHRKVLLAHRRHRYPSNVDANG